MPRDANGNYTLPPGINPVVAGTDIQDAWANPTCQDIANALTDSLSRTGSGGMLAPFKFADGTISSPGISWVNQPQSGFYRAATNDFRYSINGIDILKLAPTGAIVSGTLTTTGGITTGDIVTTPAGPLVTVNDSITNAIVYAVALG